ncbi:cupin domain-containing protein [Paenarthrobacter sp. RAF54_2]|uniref:cupin domain-containing protein n=1 Tax=Paenarthrobacter sp. RAF54_2 TaxID=3233061 RepID=UPI003F94B70E
MSTTISDRDAAKPDLILSGPLTQFSAKTPRMKARWVVNPRPEGWDTYAMSEWSLERAGFADHHPHDEVSVVLEGELHVRVGDTEVVGGPGDTIRVPAGYAGYYWAPKYARMLGIYGPNPDGQDSQALEYWEIDD